MLIPAWLLAWASMSRRQRLPTSAYCIIQSFSDKKIQAVLLHNIQACSFHSITYVCRTPSAQISPKPIRHHEIVTSTKLEYPQWKETQCPL